MKVVILTSEFGTCVVEESSVPPKPMLEIGGRPILWHVIKLHSFNEPAAGEQRRAAGS